MGLSGEARFSHDLGHRIRWLNDRLFGIGLRWQTSEIASMTTLPEICSNFLAHFLDERLVLAHKRS
jgi:hypothetical protein